MKANTFINRLRREIASSPKKAAILGLLLLVAVCYWTPLMWGWIKPEPKSVGKKKASAAASKESPEMKPVALNTTNDSTAGTTKHGWKEVAQWIDSDPRMIAASGSPGRPHPFNLVEKTPPKATGKEAEDNAKVVPVHKVPDPKDLGLVPSSTVVGPRNRAALINGKSYLLGEIIRVDHEGRTFEFELTDIRDNGIVLRRNSKQYEIPMTEPEPSDRLEINVLHDN